MRVGEPLWVNRAMAASNQGAGKIEPQVVQVRACESRPEGGEGERPWEPGI